MPFDCWLRMKETFIIVKKDARIFESIPEVKRHALDKELMKPFPQILEYGKQKFDKIFLNSLNLHYNQGIEICYVHKGCYQWLVENKEYTLYPGDVFVTNPWELHGGKEGFLDLGILSWIIIKPQQFVKNRSLVLGDWSTIDPESQTKIGDHFKSKSSHSFHNPFIGNILDQLFNELVNHELGYKHRINTLLDDLIIITTRSLIKTACTKGIADCYDIVKLKSRLASNLDYPWTVKEMADLMNLGITNFIEKTKQITGLTPIAFLIDLRIKQAIVQIETTKKSITEIAFDSGFSSLQHFSDTFKKRVGVSPSSYQKDFLLRGKVVL
jgi:AraC-like DNA-binding protein